MSVKNGWDKFEVALLIDACRRVSKGAPRQEIIKTLSTQLRRRAISQGKEIDDLFRNEAGISLQMLKMDFLLTNGEKGLFGAGKNFVDIVNLKRATPSEFVLILKEAKEQINFERDRKDNMPNMRTKFSEWIKNQGKLKIHPNSIISVLDESSEYAQKHGISKISFWEINDANTFISAYRKLSSNRLFRVIKRGTAQALDKIFVYYKDFLEKYSEDEKSIDNRNIKTKSSDIKGPPYINVESGFREWLQKKECLKARQMIMLLL